MEAYRRRPEARIKARAMRGVVKGIARSFGCAVCGRDDGRLEFHHTDPSTKRYSVSQMADCSWSTIFAEIDKCEVLCPKHHKEQHREMTGE